MLNVCVCSNRVAAMKDTKKNTPFSLCAYGFKYHTMHTHTHTHTNKRSQTLFKVSHSHTYEYHSNALICDYICARADVCS